MVTILHWLSDSSTRGPGILALSALPEGLTRTSAILVSSWNAGRLLDSCGKHPAVRRQLVPSAVLL
jgi:hypothetical protein